MLDAYSGAGSGTVDLAGKTTLWMLGGHLTSCVRSSKGRLSWSGLLIPRTVCKLKA